MNVAWFTGECKEWQKSWWYVYGAQSNTPVTKTVFLIEEGAIDVWSLFFFLLSSPWIKQHNPDFPVVPVSEHVTLGKLDI